MPDEIFNPKDILHRTYFIDFQGELYKNDTGRTSCMLSESDYEKMCEQKNINPIYPPSISLAIS